MEEVIVGVVGVLQFEVLEYRLKNEYNVDIRMQNLPYSFIRWIENEDCDPKALNLTSDTRRVEAVSYTHLDVYKRQARKKRRRAECWRCALPATGTLPRWMRWAPRRRRVFLYWKDVYKRQPSHNSMNSSVLESTSSRRLRKGIYAR